MNYAQISDRLQFGLMDVGCSRVVLERVDIFIIAPSRGGAKLDML